MSIFNIIILIFICGTASSLITNEIQAVEYLKRFGYIKHDNDHGSVCSFEKVILENALKMFQTIAGLNETGELDEDTLNRMNDYRCGMRDMGSFDVPDTDIGPYTWGSKNLTFDITVYPPYLRSNVVDIVIMQAFAFMSEHVDVVFTRVLYEPDIEIKFVKSIAENVYTSFEEGSRVTAVSSVPGLLGKIYFNDEIEWSMKNNKGFSLFRSAVHQIGHILGLGHDNFTSILSPFVGVQETFNELKDKDIAFNLLETFYGPPDSTINNNFLCRTRYIDTIYRTRNNQYLYVFIDKYYWKMDINMEQIESPKLISKKWRELVGPIDAVYQDENGWTYFFVGTHFWKYYGNILKEGYPKKIAEVFPNGPTGTLFSVIEDDNKLLLISRQNTVIYIKDNNVVNSYRYKNYEPHAVVFDTALYSRNNSTLCVFHKDKYDFIDIKTLTNHQSVTNLRYDLPEFFKCTENSIDYYNSIEKV